MTEERLDEKNLRINPNSYKMLHDRFISRTEALLNYAKTQTKCRSQLLSEYFGEMDAFRCGKCDICTQRNELDMSKYEFDLILEGLKTEILKQPCSDEELIDSLKKNPDRVIKVITYLLDNGKISRNESGQLVWNKKQ